MSEGSGALAAAELVRLFDLSPDLMAITGSDGVFRRVNPAWETVLGHPPDTLTGSRALALVHPHDHECTVRQVQAIANGGTTLRFGNRVRHQDGSYRHIEWTAAVEPGEHLMYTAGRDVTDWRVAEGDRARLAAIVDSSDDAIVSATCEGAIVTWNAGAERVYGYRASEVIGESALLLAPADRLDEAKAVLARAAEGEAIHHYETVRLHKDGRRIAVSLSVSPIHGETGAIIGASSIDRDITDRVRAVESLRAEREHNRLIMATATEPFVSIDDNGLVTEWNQRAEEVFGWPRETVLGRLLADTIVPVPLREAHRAGLQRVVAGAPPRLLDRPVEITAMHRDGHEFPVELTLWRLVRDGVQYFNAFIRDITVRKETEQALADARDQAIEASRLKSAFLGTMSHEIRTPMNGVIGLTGLLLNTDLDETQRHYAQGISTAGDALLMVINDILDFSKIGAGALVLDDIDFDVTTLIDEVIELVAEPARAKDLELIGHADPRMPAILRGDPGRLRQVLLNLASNAVKFTESGEVVVRAGLAAPDRAGEGDDRIQVRFEVTDTGIGIADTDLERMFEPFSQADASTTRRYGGTGLGLAISRELITLMGGDIGVDSTVGAGSRFWCVMPLRRGTEPAPARRSVPANLTGLRVLVVDDNETNRLVLTEQIESWRMEATSVASGAEALVTLRRAAARGRSFDLVVLDMHMPGMDGVTVARRILADPEIPALSMMLLTSAVETEPAAARALGIAATLTKPVRQSQFYNCLVRMLGAGGRAAARPAPQTAVAGKGHVLVAEDVELNRTVALGILAGLGYTADVASTGREAVDMAAIHEYAAILMDCQMPELDGYDATAELRSREGAGRHLPIIAMTAGALVEDRERCLAAGMDDHVAKPITPQSVRNVLDRWVPVAPSDPRLAQVRQDVRRRLDQLAGPDGVPNADLLVRLLRSVIDQVPAHVDDLASAVDGGTVGEVRQHAHKLKGLADNVGATAVSQASAELEQLADGERLAEAEAVLDRSRAECALLVAAATDLLAELAGNVSSFGHDTTPNSEPP